MKSATRFVFLAGILAVVAFSAAPTVADVIELKTGHKLEGDVLKQQGDTLYVDIGIDVIKVPLNQIKSRAAAKDAANLPENTQKHQLYRTAQLPRRSIKELTEKFGEGVVLVQTPGGLGSGFIVNENGFCVTNYHVIERETRIATTIFHRGEDGSFNRRRIDDVRIVALNPFFDLALLQIPVQKDLAFKKICRKERKSSRLETRSVWNDPFRKESSGPRIAIFVARSTSRQRQRSIPEIVVARSSMREAK